MFSVIVKNPIVFSKTLHSLPKMCVTPVDQIVCVFMSGNAYCFLLFLGDSLRLSFSLGPLGSRQLIGQERCDNINRRSGKAEGSEHFCDLDFVYCCWRNFLLFCLTSIWVKFICTFLPIFEPFVLFVHFYTKKNDTIAFVDQFGGPAFQHQHQLWWIRKMSYDFHLANTQVNLCMLETPGVHSSYVDYSISWNWLLMI